MYHFSKVVQWKLEHQVVEVAIGGKEGQWVVYIEEGKYVVDIGIVE